MGALRIVTLGEYGVVGVVPVCAAAVVQLAKTARNARHEDLLMRGYPPKKAFSRLPRCRSQRGYLFGQRDMNAPTRYFCLPCYRDLEDWAITAGNKELNKMTGQEESMTGKVIWVIGFEVAKELTKVQVTFAPTELARNGRQ